MPPKGTAQQPEPKKTWLVLAAHGSPGAPPSLKTDAAEDSRPTARLARAVASHDSFAGVSYGFLEANPSVQKAVEAAANADVVIVPNLACSGHVTTTKLPGALGLTGARTERVGPAGRQSLYLSPPVGASDAIPALVATLFRDAIAMAGKKAGRSVSLNKTNTRAVVVGHGSGRGRASFEQTNEIARLAALEGLKAPVQALFLDEPPAIADWAKAIGDANDTGDDHGEKNIFFLPVMISDGHHGMVDIPKAIGLDPDDVDFIKTLTDDGWVGPVSLRGYNVYFVAPLGMSTNALASIVIDLATASLGER